MKKSFITLLLLTSISLSAAGQQEVQPVQPVEKGEKKLENTLKSLRGEIDHIITLLELDKLESTEAVIRTYAIPEEITDKYEKDGKFKDLVDNFHKKKRLMVIKVLKATIKLEPKVEENNYTFALPEGLAPQDEITFMWNEKRQRFYIKN